ncbi:uncharacterized protein LAESUDRAFT_726567 [Laetiporus sulphureus 93-53]|uniref:Uncharacterized protein n=1 Tax=Laetiporus sulphureus 93-53 TaxID=1314785 RepID=A0A165E075_9APHY|nr:uncharacterized protein LAESUDRAFT_726567 [Laetiporus sulphureus 93-53]KZT05994.1 hypothetical protein LAESUDRAFT_726567 [Laetiporus sulphureus 93-53]
MAAPVFSNDMRVLGHKAKEVRTEVVDLVVPIQRVDGYADTSLFSTWQTLLPKLDKTNQAAKETEVDLERIITQYLMFHSEANNPDYTADIIIEFTAQVKQLQEGAKRADQTAEVKAAGEDTVRFKTQFETTVKAKDKAIDRALDDATNEVTRLEDKVDKIQKQLSEMQGTHNLKNLGNAVASAKGILGRKKDQDATKDHDSKIGDDDDDDKTPENKKQLEAELAAARKELQAARNVKIEAVAKADARDKADTPATQAALEKLQMDISTFLAEEEKLAAAWNAMAKEVAEYLSLFVKNRDNNSPETQRALSNHIHKVSSTQDKLKQFAQSLKDSAYNL